MHHGFQSGAYEASELTNLELVTWEEFQAKFEESWLEYFSANLCDNCRAEQRAQFEKDD